MNQSRTICCAICILWNTAGMSQTSPRPGESAPAGLRMYDHWTVFSDPRFGYELPVPPGVRAVGVPENSNETRFVSQDGVFTMTAWGGLPRDYPPRVFELQWRKALSLPYRRINYQRKAPSWFVVSGVDLNGTEFYEKFIMRGAHVAAFTLTYPHSRLQEFDSWVSKIEERFRIVSDPVDGAPETTPLNPPEQPEGIVSQSQALRRPSRIETPAKNKAPETATPKTSKSKAGLTPPKRKKAKSKPEGEDESSDEAETERPGPPEKTTAKKIPTRVTPPKEDLPYGIPVVGKPGFVNSPYGTKNIVDVVDLPRGTKVKCPYTEKAFRVP